MAVSWPPIPPTSSIVYLQSCYVVLLKEFCNGVAILYRLAMRSMKRTEYEDSIVLDGYTSIFSRDREITTQYFGNTGLVLLMMSFALDIALFVVVPYPTPEYVYLAIFIFTCVASSLMEYWKSKAVMVPLKGLLRGSSFILNNARFANFCLNVKCLILMYNNSEKLPFRQYIVFRSLAFVETLLYKTRYATGDPVKQRQMLKELLDSEYIIKSSTSPSTLVFPRLTEHKRIVSFSGMHRLFVILFKTKIGYTESSLCGKFGPVYIDIPRTQGTYIDNAEQYGWRIYRASAKYAVLEDCSDIKLEAFLRKDCTEENKGMRSLYDRLILWVDKMLLRRWETRRVVWLMLRSDGDEKSTCWRTNNNLLTNLKTIRFGNFKEVASNDYDGISPDLVQ